LALAFSGDGSPGNYRLEVYFLIAGHFLSYSPPPLLMNKERRHDMANSAIPMFDVRIVEDLVFTQAMNSNGIIDELRLDLYLPVAEPAGASPVIVWFHGGGFQPGTDKKQDYIQLLAQAFAARGYVGVAPDYRVRANPIADILGTIEDTITDAQAAVEWVRAHAAEYQLGRDRLVLAGGSAGGMIVVNFVNNLHIPIERLGVVGIVDLWGTPGGPTRLFDHVNSSSPPALIIHGTADTMVSYPNSEAFSEELQTAGVRHRLVPLNDAPHTPIMHLNTIIEAIDTFLCDLVPGG
jgi:acetyl esterase/lipase